MVNSNSADSQPEITTVHHQGLVNAKKERIRQLCIEDGVLRVCSNEELGERIDVLARVYPILFDAAPVMELTRLVKEWFEMRNELW